MPRSRRTTYNRTNRNTNTISQQRARANAAIDGRAGRNAAFTGGARTVNAFGGSQETAQMRNAWNTGSRVQTYTRSANGRLSENGRNAGGRTWTFTNRDMEGNMVSQSGRSQIATRRQREYDTRRGMNNISPRVIQAWLDNGMARIVRGGIVSNDGRTIFQKSDGNFSMGLTTG